MMQTYRYINQYKFWVLVFSIALLSVQTPAISQKFYFGTMAGHEFSSAYFDSFDNLNTSEHIKTNYSLGLIVGKVYDTALMNYKFGIYSLYRSFSVKFHEENLDTHYIDYLTEIRSKYLILGVPFSIDWKLYSRKNYFIRAWTGMSFEISVHRTEYSYYNINQAF